MKIWWVALWVTARRECRESFIDHSLKYEARVLSWAFSDPVSLRSQVFRHSIGLGYVERDGAVDVRNV